MRNPIQSTLATARWAVRHGGLPLAVYPEKLATIVAALDDDARKAAVCRTFGIARSSLIDTLARIGWTGPGSTR